MEGHKERWCCLKVTDAPAIRPRDPGAIRRAPEDWAEIAQPPDIGEDERIEVTTKGARIMLPIGGWDADEYRVQAAARGIDSVELEEHRARAIKTPLLRIHQESPDVTIYAADWAREGPPPQRRPHQREPPAPSLSHPGMTSHAVASHRAGPRCAMIPARAIRQIDMIIGLRTYSVNAKARQPLVEFMTGALARAGCRIIHSSPVDRAPFVIAFETPDGERMGIVAYAFLATRTPTRNRPPDERSFQIKYGSKESYRDDNVHELWQDPLGMFTTLLIGIDPEQGVCVSADPIIHSPTKFFIRLEFKDEHAAAIRSRGWFAWERIKRAARIDAPRVETLVGATSERFLDLVRFERAARGLDPGNRLILAEEHALSLPTGKASPDGLSERTAKLAGQHPLAAQFGLSAEEILDLIAGARRLSMAARGWVAEEHLRRTLSKIEGVTHCERLDEEGGPDLRVSFRRGPLLTIECKNVSRERDKHGNAKVDFQRTRAAKGNPCSRYYEPNEFDIVAACLHAVTSAWDFRYVLPGVLPAHKICEGRIASNIKVDSRWTGDATEIFRQAYAARGMTL